MSIAIESIPTRMTYNDALDLAISHASKAALEIDEVDKFREGGFGLEKVRLGTEGHAVISQAYAKIAELLK